MPGRESDIAKMASMCFRGAGCARQHHPPPLALTAPFSAHPRGLRWEGGHLSRDQKALWKLSFTEAQWARPAEPIVARAGEVCRIGGQIGLWPHPVFAHGWSRRLLFAEDRIKPIMDKALDCALAWFMESDQIS